VSLAWHPKINHLLCGTSAGKTYAFYDPALSAKGAMLSAGARCRPRDPNDFQAPEGVIHNPHALPMYREEAWGKRKRRSDRKDPVKSRRPEMPHAGPGAQGKIQGEQSSFAMHYRKQMIERGPSIREQVRTMGCDACMGCALCVN
jgi:hypothetical protein